MKSGPVWRPGDAILHQALWLDHLLDLRPVTVVEDGPGRIVLYTHPASAWATRRTYQGPRQERGLAERIDGIMRPPEGPMQPRPANGFRVLTMTPSDAAHAVWLFWNADWTFRSWFVNLQAPAERNADGIVERDHTLDIRVAPDGSWTWKDRDEFDELRRRGFYSEAQAREIMAEGERVIPVIERRAGPFAEGWERWRPDPGWPIPKLPADWERWGGRELSS